MEHTPSDFVSQNNPSDQPTIPPRNTETVARHLQPPTGDQGVLYAGTLVQERNFPCYFCFSVFTTQRALLEHLRTNPPPPVFSREQLMDLRLLLPEADDDDAEVAADASSEEVLSEDASPEAIAVSDQGARATTRAPLGIDLNVEPSPELPDLNLPPPPDDGNN